MLEIRKYRQEKEIIGREFIPAPFDVRNRVFMRQRILRIAVHAPATIVGLVDDGARTAYGVYLF